MKPLRDKGFTVIEMVAALAVLSLVAFGGVRAAQNYYRDADYRLLERNAAVVLGALNSYYAANCSASSMNPSPSITQLVTQGHLKSSIYANNPLGSALYVFVNQTSPPVLFVMAPITDGSARNLSNTLSGSYENRGTLGGVVQWRGLPTLYTADDNIYNMQLKNMYEPGACQ